MVKFFGSSMLNDKKLLDDFWALVEHLLNTVLFALGGAVSGLRFAFILVFLPFLLTLS